MDQLQPTIVDELINVLLDTIMRLKDLLQKPDCFVPHYIRPKMQEIYEWRQASLERYWQQYALEHSDDDDDDDFQGGEDEIDGSKKLENLPLESYYTARCKL